MQENLYMGLDCSTQSFTATIIDLDKSEIILTQSVNFEKDLADYNTTSGVVYAEGGVVFSYADMWAEGLETLFSLLYKEVDLSKIKAISASGQQHASVYLKRHDFDFDSGIPLVGQVRDCLSRRESPVWLDTSTSQECEEITRAMGGENAVLETTGSIATMRFTASQIRKFFKENPAAYEDTKRIHLNSSFICSVLAGKDCPIDFGDGAGMNLMNIEELCWDKKALEATSPKLEEKLPSLVASDTCVGNISDYFVANYGFSKEAKIIVSTGDNPSSLIGIGAMLEGSAIISLGTSDTYFSSVIKPKAAANAHIFGNPAGNYMSLICFRNGSLAREAMKDMLGVSWEFFDKTAFEGYIPSEKDENFIIPFFSDEISPNLASDSPKFIPSENMTQVEKVIYTIEGQFLNIYTQAKKFSQEEISSIILTGGASKSEGIAQVIADIFQAKVSRLKLSLNSAALGACMRAIKNDTGLEWQELSERFCGQVDFKLPRAEYAKIYKQKACRWNDLINKIEE